MSNKTETSVNFIWTSAFLPSGIFNETGNMEFIYCILFNEHLWSPPAHCKLYERTIWHISNFCFIVVFLKSETLESTFWMYHESANRLLVLSFSGPQSPSSMNIRYACLCAQRPNNWWEAWELKNRVYVYHRCEAMPSKFQVLIREEFH